MSQVTNQAISRKA